jgi:hypothetical protein
VRRIERVGNFDDERQHSLDFHRPSGDLMLERNAIQKLHRNERLAMLVVYFVDGTNVGVVQGRGSLGFALESA